MSLGKLGGGGGGGYLPCEQVTIALLYSFSVLESKPLTSVACFEAYPNCAASGIIVGPGFNIT